MATEFNFFELSREGMLSIARRYGSDERVLEWCDRRDREGLGEMIPTGNARIRRVPSELDQLFEGE